jgi:hypothetical protein
MTGSYDDIWRQRAMRSALSAELVPTARACGHR